ncbi:hypothetical protein Bbelb_148780 [Branchiostoma belcheri]|nr:hypothetical protein Bbelb_148780 [Branchiostoma belcheri]
MPRLSPKTEQSGGGLLPNVPCTGGTKSKSKMMDETDLVGNVSWRWNNEGIDTDRSLGLTGRREESLLSARSHGRSIDPSPLAVGSDIGLVRIPAELDHLFSLQSSLVETKLLPLRCCMFDTSPGPTQTI